MFDQAKMVMKLKKAEKELSKLIIEVTSGPVTVQVDGKLKLKKVTIDPSQVDLNDIGELEKSIKLAVGDATQRAQEAAAEKMKPLMGSLGNLGL